MKLIFAEWINIETQLTIFSIQPGSIHIREHVHLSLSVNSRHMLAIHLKVRQHRGAWGAQSVKRLISAQVMISQLVSLSPTSGSVLTARSLEPASDSVSVSVSVSLSLSPSLCPFPAHALSLSLKNKFKKNNK